MALVSVVGVRAKFWFAGTIYAKGKAVAFTATVTPYALFAKAAVSCPQERRRRRPVDLISQFTEAQMRTLEALWLDKETNTIEVRFDDGGCAVQMPGSDTETLRKALIVLEQRIQELERQCPYPQALTDGEPKKGEGV